MEIEFESFGASKLTERLQSAIRRDWRTPRIVLVIVIRNECIVTYFVIYTLIIFFSPHPSLFLSTTHAQVSVPIVSNEKCKSMFLRAGRHEVIPQIFMCAGYDNGGRDSCQVSIYNYYVVRK